MWTYECTLIYLVSVDVKRILREKIFDQILRTGASYNEYLSSSEVVQVSTEWVEQLETYFGKYLPQFFYSLLAPITLFIIFSQVNLKASVILLICVPLIPISIVAVQKFAKKLLSNYWSVYTVKPQTLPIWWLQIILPYIIMYFYSDRSLFQSINHR